MNESTSARPFIIDALRLRLEEGLPYREISERLDVGVSAIHKMVQRFFLAHLIWPLDESWNAEKLEQALYPSTRPKLGSTVKQRRPNYTTGFKLHLVKLTMKPGVSVAQIARDNDINANMLFNWRQQYKVGKLAVEGNSVVELLPVVLSPDKLRGNTLPVTNDKSHMQKPESGNSAETLICELLLPAGTLRLSGNITAEILQTLVRELEGIRKQ